MKTLLTLFVLLFSSSVFADQGYNLVQVNCYPNSGYFELRYFETSNLNMHTQDIFNEENLYSLTDHQKNDFKKIKGECSFKKNDYVKKNHSIVYIIEPFCSYKYPNGTCGSADAIFSITYKDRDVNKSLIDKGQFCLLNDHTKCGFGERNGSRITNVEYLAKDTYFKIVYRKELETGVMKIITKTIFIDGFLDKQQYPFDLNIFLD